MSLQRFRQQIFQSVVKTFTNPQHPLLYVPLSELAAYHYDEHYDEKQFGKEMICFRNSRQQPGAAG